MATNEGLPLLANGYRYRGSNPNNWVCFGSSSITNPSSCDDNHKWRIIGVFNGQMKIMTNYYYAKANDIGRVGMLWDDSDANGNNNWARPARLNTDLNGNLFYNNTAYIDEAHRGYIANGTWYIGGENPSGSYTLQAFIDGEKSSHTTGKIGLISVVDFGYAGSNCTLSTNMTSRGNACMSNNWIKNLESLGMQWTITPQKSNQYSVYIISTAVCMQLSKNGTGGRAHPALYLKSSIKITGGTGTENSPYILEI